MLEAYDDEQTVSRYDNQPPEEERIIDFKTAEVFTPLLEPRRFKGAKGGRGGAKSHFFAEMFIEDAIQGHTRQACVREVQNSIKDSVKQLIEDKIADLGVEDLFHCTEQEIRGPNESLAIFRGLRNHTSASIKSLEGFTRCWVEEAQTISQRSLDILIPTFRSNSELSFSWNPYKPDDPIDVFFRQNKGDPDFICVNTTYLDNPWLPDELRRDAERDRRRDPDKYHHVWMGGYIRHSEARVFKNWRIESFETPSRGVFFLHGADWGYSIDPTVLIRCWIGRWEDGKAVPDVKGTCLFIDHEVYQVGVELDHTPRLFDQLDRSVTGIARDWSIIADSANPQAISYLKRHGYPHIKASIKGPGSIKEGINFLKSYDIIVHPRCKHVETELTHFSYKLDPLTNLVTPELQEKKNHTIDSIRYALEPVRRPSPKLVVGSY